MQALLLLQLLRHLQTSAEQNQEAIFNFIN